MKRATICPLQFFYMKQIVKFLISILSLVITDNLFDSVYFDSYQTVIIFALVLYILNIFVKPILFLLTLPITLVTLGFFILILNTLIILLAAEFVKGIHFPGFWTAFWFSVVYSLIQIILNAIFIKDIQVKVKIEK